MSQILTPYFWFSLRGPLTPVTSFVLWTLILLFAAALAYIKYTEDVWQKNMWRAIYKKIRRFSAANLLVGLYLSFITDQLVPVFSARIWFLLWAVEMVVWLRSIYKEYLLIPEKKKLNEEKNKLRKYIP